MSDQWISATATRNFVFSDPLVDWLNLYGHDKGFKPDTEYEDYDERTDYPKFIMQKGIEFESVVISHFEKTCPAYTALRKGERSFSSVAFDRTRKAIEKGEPLIYQAVLKDNENLTFGVPDLLIRSDLLRKFFPAAISEEESLIGAEGCGEGNYHYRVIDIKFATLSFLKAGDIQASSGSTLAYMCQVYIYNRALAAMQGYRPEGGYLLGRGWSQNKIKGDSFMDRLGFVPDSYVIGKGDPLSSIVDASCQWSRRVREEGSEWDVTPDVSVPELRPYMRSRVSYPWNHAKSEINAELQDLTTLWQVGVPARKKGNDAGVYRWSDPGVNSSVLGITGSKNPLILDSLIEINQISGGPEVKPDKIVSANQTWRDYSPVEFFVDFETVSNVNDDFSSAPIKGGQTLIFMIGCGHIENGQWEWKSFTVDLLEEDFEADIIDDWLDHMAVVKARLSDDDFDPIVFHWSPAEKSFLEQAYNSAVVRHPEKSWRRPNWFDFWKEVAKSEPVLVKGSFGFGLKSMADALRSHGLIDTSWDSSTTDGLGAMAGAWWVDDTARKDGVSMIEIPLMKDIERYNEVDCKVMMEIIRYLRENH